MKRILSLMLAIFLLSAAAPAAFAADFSDVPPGYWAYSYINRLRELNITDGVRNNLFAPGKTLTRAEFVTFTCRIMGWRLETPDSGGYSDNQDKTQWYFPYIETALKHNAVTSESDKFRPMDPITREEMAVMLVRALGYDELAASLAYLDCPFTDVVNNKGYIIVANDFGIINGVGGSKFAPGATALREHAAAMLIRMHDGMNRNIKDRNAFYAISSASQMDMLADFNSACFGWARLSVEKGLPYINTTTSNGNEYYLPPGYSSPYGKANGERYFFIAADSADAAYILSDPDVRQQAARIMAYTTIAGIAGPNDEAISFDGVVVDFEGLKGAANRQSLNEFLAVLRTELDRGGKKMIVAVHPARREIYGYYDGYDYRTIGEYADKVILMAHDYNAKQLTPSDMERGVTYTPPAPIDEIYYALRAITNPDTGVRQRDKIMLQISFGSVQWKLQNGRVINEKPFTPGWEAVKNRINSGAERHFDANSKSPYITFYNSDDQTENIVWYEDAESVGAKLSLAKMFGITGVSVWRLGLVPEGVKI